MVYGIDARLISNTCDAYIGCGIRCADTLEAEGADLHRYIAVPSGILSLMTSGAFTSHAGHSA
jgi:hypothetical protein